MMGRFLGIVVIVSEMEMVNILSRFFFCNYLNMEIRLMILNDMCVSWFFRLFMESWRGDCGFLVLEILVVIVLKCVLFLVVNIIFCLCLDFISVFMYVIF